MEQVLAKSKNELKSHIDAVHEKLTNVIPNLQSNRILKGTLILFMKESNHSSVVVVKQALPIN